MALAAPVLFLSLFLTWSNQFSSRFLARWGRTSALQGVPRTPTAWQVYSDADVMLALIAVSLLVVSLWGGRARRVGLGLALSVAMAFTVHAIGTPPTNGAVVFDAAAGTWARNSPSAGAGEWVALVALAGGAVGLALSFTVER